MKKQLFMTPAMAATLLAATGCSSAEDDWNQDAIAQQDTAVCVDSSGTRVDDDRCDDDRYRGGSSAFLWYYIGRSSALPYYGDSIRDRRFAGRGSYRPVPGASYQRAPASTRVTRSQAVSRGGFGSSSRRFGGARS
jgi:hypothetical protein